MLALTLFVLCMGANCVMAANQGLRVGVLQVAPFYMPDGTGYEASVINNICYQLNATCTITSFGVEDRITSLQNGTADITMGGRVFFPSRQLVSLPLLALKPSKPTLEIPQRRYILLQMQPLV